VTVRRRCGVIMAHAQSSLVFNGERAIPDHLGSRHEFCKHLFAYEFVSSRLRAGMRVLDLGSGEGYGSSLLARGGAVVVGVDISSAAVARAEGTYGGDGASFAAMDAQHLGLRSGVFKMVVSFQTIEHLEHPRRYLEEVARVLEPGGTFIVSTLNKRLYSPRQGTCCVECHVREFEAPELHELLCERFTDVEILGVQASQRVRDLEFVADSPRRRRSRTRTRMARYDFWGMRRLIPEGVKESLVNAAAAVARLGMLCRKAFITTADFWVSPENIDSALDLLAVCQNPSPRVRDRSPGALRAPHQLAEYPKVCVIMVNWNGHRHLAYSLPSLSKTRYSNAEYVFVDNGSEDDSVEFASRLMPRLIIIRNAENLGWTGGNNVGIRHALGTGARYVALVNTDMFFDSRWLYYGVQAAEEDEKVGIVGFHVVGEYGKEDVSRFHEATESWDRLETRESEHISGCALLIKVDVIHAVGLLDEAYFCYGDEDDFELRAKRAGYRMIRVNVPLWHFSEGGGERGLARSRLAMRNQLRYAIKNLSVKEIAIQMADLVSIACNPLRRVSATFAHHRRLRPSNIVVNGGILLYGFGWNLVQLPRTLAARRRDLKRLAAVFSDRDGGSIRPSRRARQNETVSV